MKIAPTPLDEEKRLSDLKKYSVLDTPTEIAFDNLTKLAATICEAKIALVSLIDKDRQWFKSRFGLEATETPRDISFCGHAIMGDDIFIVEDAELDDRFCDNPLVLNEPNVRFYAGVPLITPTGSRIGTLCVIDSQQKVLSDIQKQVLKALADQVVYLLRLKFKREELNYLNAQYANVQEMSQTYARGLDKHAIVVKTDSQGTITYVNDLFCELSGYLREELLGYNHRILNSGEHPKIFFKDMWDSITHGLIWKGEIKNKAKNGTYFWVDTTITPLMDANGNIMEFLAIRFNITGRKEAEEKLKISESTHRLLFDQASDAVMTISPPTWKFSSANPATLKLFGAVSAEHFCSLGLWSISPEFQPDGQLSADKAKTMIMIAMDKGSHSFEWTHLRLDGVFLDCTVLLSKIVEANKAYLHATVRDISNEKKIKSQLIEAQAISKVGSWSLNLITNEQNWSIEHYKIFEIDYPQPQDQLYQLYRNRIHSDDLKELDHILKLAIMEGKGFTFDHRVVFDNGKRIKYVQGIGKVTLNEFGKPIYLTGTCRDRTLDFENDKRYQELMESMQEGLVVQVQGGAITHFNKAALNILERSADQLMGKSSTDPSWRAIKENGDTFLAEEHPAMITLRTGAPQRNVIMGLKLLNNTIKWIRINSIPFKIDGNDCALTTFADITELLIAKEENRFVLETVGVGVWKYNPNTKKLVWDNSMYKIYGIDPKDFNGDYDAWENSLPDEAKAEAVKALEVSLAGGKEFDHTFEVKSNSPHKKFLGAKAKVIRDQNGLPLMMYGINWDKTKEVELERNLNLERAKSLHNAKLATIGELAAGVGHEINNPLAILSGQLIILEQTLMKTIPLQDEVFVPLKKMDRALQRIDNIVKNLRTFARSDDLQISGFDLYNLAFETIEMLKELYSKENVELNFIGLNTVCLVEGYRGRLQQVLINLISNAKDATLGKETRKVDVIFSIDSNEVLIEVADNGCGVPDEIKESIFVPFFTTKEVNKGTGIGLSLISTIIKEHKGNLSFSSKEGEGSRFTFSLPIFFGEPVKVNSNLKLQNSVTHEKINCNVLIVDDEEDLRDIFKFIISQFCSNVKTASGAQEGHQIICESKIDLVISDIRMPGKDGFDFLRMIQENKNIITPKFVFITGGVNMTEAELKMVEESDGLLTKPLIRNDAFNKIKKLFPDILISS